MSNPLTIPTTSQKPVLKIIYIKIVIDHMEPLDEDKDYSERKHNLRVPWIVLIGKLYHDWKGKPSPIGDVNESIIGG